MSANGIDEYMAISSFGTPLDAKGAAALSCQKRHSFCFIEAPYAGGEALRDFDVIAGVKYDIGIRPPEFDACAAGEQ
jgi:hypothetical protein